jgi:predicted ester cyclase
MSEENKELMQRWFEQVWNQKSEAAIDAMFPPDGKSYGFPDPESVLLGPEDFKTIHRNFCGAFPDLKVTVDDVIAEGDRVAVRWSVTITHLGDHLGFAATGKKARLLGASIVRIKDGLIVEGWNYMELLGLIQELRGLQA